MDSNKHQPCTIPPSGPLVGKYLSIWGVKAIFPAGFIIDGGTFILFGLLQWVEDTTAFLIFSYLIRFLEVTFTVAAVDAVVVVLVVV